MSQSRFSVFFLSFAWICFCNSATLCGQNFVWKLQSSASSAVNALRCEFSPDSALFAIACSDDSVRLVDLTTGAETLRMVGHKDDVTDISFSPDGKRLITCANQEYPLGGFRVWSIVTGECLYTQDTSPNRPSCHAVAYRPDGKFFVAETYVRLPSGAISSWSVEEFDARTFKPIRKLLDLAQNANSLAFSGDGRLLLIGDAGSANHRARLVDLRSNLSRLLEQQLVFPTVSPDGRYIAATLNAKEAVLLDARTLSEVRRFQGGDANDWRSTVSSLVFSSDSQSLFARSDRQWFQWSLATGKVLQSGETSFANRSALAISPNGRFLAQTDGGGKVILWEIEDSKPLARIVLNEPEASWAIETQHGYFHYGDQFSPAFSSLPNGINERTYIERYRSSINVQTELVSKIAALERDAINDSILKPHAITGMSIDGNGPKRIQQSNRGRLFVLSVGVSEYDDSTFDLLYADSDADAIAATLLRQKGNGFEDVQTQVFVNKQATVTNVKEGLTWLERSCTASDTAVVLFSGHGIQAERGLYYVTHEANLKGLQYTCLNWETVASSLQQTKANQILVLTDACFAGAFGDSELPNQQLISEKLRGSRNVTVFTSSRGNEVSFENESGKHGAFALAILESLGGKGDVDQNGKVDISEITAYATRRVAELTGDSQHPIVALLAPGTEKSVIAKLTP